MDVVAEGVESEEQLNFLKDMNCEYGQGYYYSKPLESSDAFELIEKLSQQNQSSDFPPPNYNVSEVAALNEVH